MQRTLQPQAPVNDTVELSELAKLLRRHSGIVCGVGALVFAAGVSWALLGSMRFVSTGRMYLGELESRGSAGAVSDDIDLSAGDHGDIASEIEILKSRSLVTRAVLDAGLNVTVVPPGWRPPRYYRWLTSGRSRALLDVPSRELIAVGTSLAGRAAPRRTFAVQFLTDTEYEVRESGRLLGGGKLGDSVACEGLTIRLLPGTQRGPAAGARYGIEVEPLEGMVDAALKALDVASPASKAPSGGEPVKVVSLSFSDGSPRRAAGFLEELMNGYLEERHAWKTQNATAAVAFLTLELTKTRATLDDLQSKLATYRAKNGSLVLEGGTKGMIDQIGQYEEQRVAAQLEVDSLTAVNEQLRGPKPPLEAYMMGEAKDDTVLMGLATTLLLSQQKLAEAETHYNAPAPEVQSLRAQVDSQLQAIRSYVRTRLARARESLRTLDGVVSHYEEKLTTVPSAEFGLAQLTRETEVYSAMYSQLLKKQQEAALVKASSISKNRILDAPQVPYCEEPLRMWIGLASGPLGLVLGMLLVLFRSLVSGRLQHGADIRRHLGAIPVLSTIPHLARESDRLSPVGLEAFRTLRANIDNTCRRDFGNVILFTSPCSGDGKSTILRHLASSLARCGRSVLLIDTGLRKQPSFDTGTSPVGLGLGAILLGQRAWRDVVREVAVIDGGTFDTIQGGNDESTDLLSSAAMFDFIAEVRDLYDFVLLEAPSFPAASDTLVLSAMASCVVAVIRMEHTSRHLAVDNVRQLSTTTSNYWLLLNDVTA